MENAWMTYEDWLWMKLIGAAVLAFIYGAYKEFTRR